MSQPSYSLAQLQGMTREQLETAFPQTVPKWVKRGLKVNIRALIKAIISATKKLHYPLTDNRGNREIWYNPVKPILLKADPKRVNNPNANYMTEFERVLSDMVRNGELAYADLGVSDFRTMRELFTSEVNANCWRTELLFVEKDSAYVHLKPLQSLFNINIMSGGGWGHSAGIERMLRDLRDKGVTEVVVFSLTDWDNFGFGIAWEFCCACETLGLHVVEHHRIGINPEHATPEILEVQKYPIKRERPLNVHGKCFNSDEWLKQYGIEGKYGLEIEAISGQPGGHAYLRKIVATELLKHLDEQDRIEEFTQKAWERVPFNALSNLMYSIDENEVNPKDLEEPPTASDMPRQFLTVQQYHNLTIPIIAEREEAAEDIDAEIDDLEEQLENLRTEKSEIEQPFNDQINVLANQYWKSRRLLVYHLWQYYQENKDKWPRQNYSLGFPKGCMITNLEKENDVRTMLSQLDTRDPIEHITKAFKDLLSNGELEARIANYIQGLGEKTRKENNADNDSDGESHE